MGRPLVFLDSSGPAELFIGCPGVLSCALLIGRGLVFLGSGLLG